MTMNEVAIAKNAAVQKELNDSYVRRAVTQQLARMWVSRYYPDTLRIELVKPQQKSATTEDVVAALKACGADYPNVTLVSENLNFQVFEVRI